MVLSGEGLVGRIIGVSERASRVLLITDINSRSRYPSAPRVCARCSPATIRIALAWCTSSWRADPCGRSGGHLRDRRRSSVRTCRSAPSSWPTTIASRQDDVDRARLEYVRVVDYGVGEMHVDPPMAALRHAASKRLPANQICTPPRDEPSVCSGWMLSRVNSCRAPRQWRSRSLAWCRCTSLGSIPSPLRSR